MSDTLNITGDIPVMGVPKIYKAINNIMREVGFIGKDSTCQGGSRFKYRGIDAVMNALNPALINNGVFVVPNVIDVKREERTSKSGSTMIYSVIKVKYTFYAEDGSYVEAVVSSEGSDTSDKSMNCALSCAFKYACFQVFCIPTEEMIDPDSRCEEVASKPSKVEYIDENTAVVFDAVLKGAGVDVEKFMQQMKITKLTEVTTEQYAYYLRKLKDKNNG